MPRKKSIKRCASEFVAKADELEAFLASSAAGLSDKEQSWCHDYAIIRLYREFEQMMLSAIVGAINNDTATIAYSTGIDFPKHLTDEVCEYLVLGGGYFDFKGRDGLIKQLKKYVPDNHYLLTIVRQARYRQPLERLTALRNYAAHESAQSKRAVLQATGQQRIGSAGSWLKTQGRYTTLSGELRHLGQEIQNVAPY
ncbi:hypothetical protein [Ectothiorhodospira sp. BSL-9]|uniref:hypothetical protein n=1 Tax=Ectothiorhodospira sp. BSL-9 TaxID=1442136 RepID=UPI0007B44E0D|nr:hypothetical protein [Ectothiorhodospira sp. BSL-9]ANB03647.1 hypothetical protein ECTOBSL9_0725 [Ectothiorhodospira sp. BSL-9]